MIKRISFLRRAPSLAPDGFAAAWRDDALRRHDAAPAEGRPRRVAHCCVRQGRTQQPHDGVALEWFADASALAEHDRWSAEHAGGEPVVDAAATSTVVVEERTALGNDWLEARWADPDGAPRPMLVGLIERASGLDRTGFRDYWWGTHRPLADATVPAELGPVAYVHNYALPGERFRWDGIGELYERSLPLAAERGTWFASEAAAPLVADELNFMVPSTRVILTTDHRVVVA